LEMRTFIGKVVSNKMMKTVVVAVDRFRPHPKYRKVVRKTTKLMAHDENNSCNMGDQVRINSSRPLSKHKAWIVTDILRRARIFEGANAQSQIEAQPQPGISGKYSADKTSVL